MSKRLTNTEIWQNPWFRKLEPKQKCLWKYICDKCDISGVWQEDLELASFYIGDRLEEGDLIAFGERISKLRDGVWHLTGFIEWQYKNSLKHWVKPQKAVIDLLEKHGLSELYSNCIHTVQDKDMDKDKDKDKDNIVSFYLDSCPEKLKTEQFDISYREWIDYRATSKKPLTKLAVTKQLNRLAGMGEVRAVAAINNSIEKQYQGIYESGDNKAPSYEGGSRWHS